MPETGQLLSYHNLYFQKDLMTRQRNAILDGTYDAWVSGFLARRYGRPFAEKVPAWVLEALQAAEIELK